MNSFLLKCWKTLFFISFKLFPLLLSTLWAFFWGFSTKLGVWLVEVILFERGWSKQNGTVIFCEAAQTLIEVFKGWWKQNKRVAMGCKQITKVIRQLKVYLQPLQLNNCLKTESMAYNFENILYTRLCIRGLFCIVTE